MQFSINDLPEDLKETLEAVYRKAKRAEPQLTETEFFTRVFCTWLKPYSREKIKLPSRKKVVLRNRLAEILAAYDISYSQIARQTGISRTYISRIIRQEYTPTITVAYLICLALGLDLSKVPEIFYLEEKE